MRSLVLFDRWILEDGVGLLGGVESCVLGLEIVLVDVLSDGDEVGVGLFGLLLDGVLA